MLIVQQAITNKLTHQHNDFTTKPREEDVLESECNLTINMSESIRSVRFFGLDDEYENRKIEKGRLRMINRKEQQVRECYNHFPPMLLAPK